MFLERQQQYNSNISTEKHMEDDDNLDKSKSQEQS